MSRVCVLDIWVGRNAYSKLHSNTKNGSGARISTYLLQGWLQFLELDGGLLWEDGAAQRSGEGEAEARQQHL